MVGVPGVCLGWKDKNRKMNFRDETRQGDEPSNVNKHCTLVNVLGTCKKEGIIIVQVVPRP